MNVGRYHAPPLGEPTEEPSASEPSKTPSVSELLETPGALLTRTHLRELGFGPKAVDAVFRQLPVVALPGYSRPMIRVCDFLALLEDSTYRGDRVRRAA